MGKKKDHIARADDELGYLLEFFEERLGVGKTQFQKKPVLIRSLLDFWVTLRCAGEGEPPPTYPEHPEG